MYSCTAVGCFKGTSTPKFQKTETLTQHIKESHKPDTVFSCPVRTCPFEPSKLDDLVIHAHWMHTSNPSELLYQTRFQDGWKEVSSFVNAASWKYFRCPIWDCRKFVSGGYEKVSAHLLAHSRVQLESGKDGLANGGYEIQFAPYVSRWSPGHPHGSSVQIRCPTCGVLSKDDAKFRHHIETSHMLAKSPGMLEHFETWRKDIISQCRKGYMAANHNVEDRPCWLAQEIYYAGLARIDILSYGETVKCSYSTCSFDLKGTMNSHPSFLHPDSDLATDLWEHRVEILRHHPQFITHPMFQEPHHELEIR
jgi:hypothetical protein